MPTSRLQLFPHSRLHFHRSWTDCNGQLGVIVTAARPLRVEERDVFCGRVSAHLAVHGLRRPDQRCGLP
jgi:hypothetical protein